MSLYNNIAESLSNNGLVGSVRSGISGAIGGVTDAAAQAMGGGKLARTVAGIGKSAAVNAGMNAVNKHIPVQAQRALQVGSGAAGDLMRGDWESAGMRVLDSGLLNKALPGFGGGAASQVAFWGKATPLFGGISPAEAKRIYDEIRGQRLAKKNLWLLEVTSRLRDGSANLPDRFNLFATEVDYTPFNIAGDKSRIGGVVVDMPQGTEAVEIRITTLDDDFGSLKKWFANHHGQAAARDGTVGVPASYAITIRIVHSFISRDSNRGGYEDLGLFRTGTLEVSLSRREDALQEVQMTFIQLDTFMSP